MTTDAAAGGRTAMAQAAVREAARAHDIDRYLSALLVPRTLRGDLVALAAFSGELRHAARAASEARIGEIRLQWWAEAIAASDDDGGSGHPVADAVRDLVRRGRVGRAELLALVTAEQDGLLAPSPTTDKMLAARLDATEGARFRLAAGVASGGADASQDARAALYAAAQGYALARLLADLPLRLARGETPPIPGLAAEATAPQAAEAAARLAGLARQQRATARAVASGLDRAERKAIGPALLPAALTEPYLRAFEGWRARLPGGTGVATAELLPLARVWSLLKARHTGWL